MPYSEAIKKKVRENAAFRCCRCQEIGIEVHHIIPEEYDGPNTEENAAPLCPNCHTYFGDNPQKRKEITHMRDWWYRKVKELFPNSSEMLEEIHSTIQNLQVNQNASLKELKGMLKSVADDMIEHITPETAHTTASGILNASAASSSSVTLGNNVHANFSCSNCGTRIGLLVGRNSCPICGAPIA